MKTYIQESRDIAENLLRVFRESETIITDDCFMSELVMAYALDEHDAEKAGQIKEHLLSCRFCLDLFLDTREAERESREREVSEVLPGLADAIQEKPLSLYLRKIQDITSRFISSMLPSKFVAVMAAVFLIAFLTVIDRTIYINFRVIADTGITAPRGQDETLPKSSDFYKIRFELNKDAFVYAIFHDSSGETGKACFGRKTAGVHEVSQGDSGIRFQLDYNTGTETVYLLASKEEINGFDKKAEKLKQTGINEIKNIFPKASIKSFSYKHE